MSRIHDRLQALHRRSAEPARDETFDRAAALAAYIERDQSVPSRAPAAPVPGDGQPSDLRARLQRLHRVPDHVGPPESFAPKDRRRPPPAPPNQRSPDLRREPHAAPAPGVASTRPVAGALLARLDDAVAFVTNPAPGLARVCAAAPRPTPLGRYLLHDVLDVIVTLDDLKLMLPVGVRARDAVFFDIESTGLAFDTCHAFVLGAASVAGDDVVVEQLVPLSPDAEAESLRCFGASVAGAAAVVTFNGSRFDLPFLAARSALHGLPDPFAGVPHIDLYRVARHTLRKKLHRYSLAALEAHALGMERVDDLPGREAPAAYLRFLATGDPAAVARVLDHNRLDLLSMIPLLGVLTGSQKLPDPPRIPPEDLAASGFIALGAHEVQRAAGLLAGAVDDGLRGPMRRRALRELGRIALSRGETAEAATRLEAACAEPGGDAESHAMLAEVYEDHLAEPGHALRHARRAVTLQPWNGPLRERLTRLELLFS